MRTFKTISRYAANHGDEVEKLAKALEGDLLKYNNDTLLRFASSIISYVYDHTGSEKLRNVNYKTYQELGGECQSAYDHPYCLGDSIILEPYHLNLESLQNLIGVCQKYNLDMIIDGFSRHFPGQTIRISLGERKLLSASQ